MISKICGNGILRVVAMIVLYGTVVNGQNARDVVKGNLIQFNDNGAWCWYQDERAVVDKARGRLIVGSDASDNGVGGSPRNGDIDAVIFDLQNRQAERYALMEGGTNFGGCDDHHAPAFLVMPDGRYLAFYAGHNSNNNSYWRFFYTDRWGIEHAFNWNNIPGGTDFRTTYSNLFYLAAEDKLYNIARTYARSPNLMVSTDSGQNWSYGGLLTEPDVSIGYVNGYFKYWSSGVDRIDFVATEHHPRDYNTSIYHGYMKNGQSFKSDGTLLDSDITDKTAPKPADFTLVFGANTRVNGDLMSRCWAIDLAAYDDGTIATIFKARVNDDPNHPSNDPDHAFFYARYDGATWTSTYLGKAGKKMYSSEQDYVGLGALHPNDPEVIFISTPFDPRDDAALGVREILKGVTADHGATWTWTPITQKSVRDNFRPIVPSWDENNTALLWWRGTYLSAQNFDAAVVGIIECNSETVERMHYVDATAANTFLTNGSPLITTGPDANMGAADDRWHERTGFGNGNSVLTSAEVSGENAPVLKTQMIVSEAGTYDVWINFWANPTADWRIKAGLAADRMQLFRQMACKQVEADDHDTALTLTSSGNTFLYQAYLGRVRVAANETLNVYVDDHAIQTGTSGTRIGNTARTWYDGVSYAKVNTAVVSVAEHKKISNEFVLRQNSPNPFKPSTTITYSLPKAAHVTVKVYNLLGREVATLTDQQTPAGTHQVIWNAQSAPSGIYFYKISVGNFSKTKKMILLQ
ncbi:T9SS C-terminal target domain-containing protein [candidate division KSB1 bacterium]|nr:MAG: T9SS C-terminal target domain-containing protein [candidate division KSB1 bacterium]MBC6946354.1 T9SS C-terminal target domain-containing protein [candidate division KSB1 bacterium]MCE7940707.1 T9SS C-terminal target domain-containing protein [Chlorobi bacterium CHB1]MDL1874084.1 T9SS type A sorting domain-containing protein [Cytophagia bacterium CHB2]